MTGDGPDLRPRVFVLSRRGQGAVEVARAFNEDREPECAPYGFNLAAHTGWNIRYSHDKPHTRASQSFFGRFEFDFFHAINNLAEIRRADIVWTMLEWEWLAVALLQRVGLAPRRPVIANSVWLADKWDGHSPAKRRFIKWLMLPYFEMTLHSRRGLDHLRAMLPKVRWRISPFGISTRAFPVTPPAFRPRNNGPIRVYAIGNDGSRDWATMLAAFGNDPRFDVTIVCGWLEGDNRHANVRRPDVTTIAHQRDEYHRADVVVIPMHPNRYSGITVALEAAAMGKPIVSTATGGVDTYFGANEALFVPPHNAAALRNAVLATSDAEWQARASAGQARLVARDYSAEAMIGRYVADTRRLLGI